MLNDKECPKLSVIVPVYNAEIYLDRCIQSIVNQTYRNIELILIDDGSTDQSLLICEKWAKKDSRICVFHIKNGGPANARNYGIKKSTGRFIAFVDADDFLNLDMYETIIDSLVRTNSGMGVCKWTSHNMVTGEKEIIDIGLPGVIEAQEVKKIIASNDNFCGGGYLWNKVIDQSKVNVSIKDDILFRSELKIYEDKIWLLELLDYIDEVVLIDMVGYNYEIRQNSLSHGNFSDKIKHFLSAMDVIENECFGAVTTEAIDKYKANAMVFWFWKARKETKSASIVNSWQRQRICVKKNLKKLSVKCIVKFFVLDFIFRIDGVLWLDK